MSALLWIVVAMTVLVLLGVWRYTVIYRRQKRSVRDRYTRDRYKR